MYTVVVSSLDGTARIVALASPLYIVGLLLFVSGVPLLEKSADKKWGKDKAFISYKSQVPSVIPNVLSIRRALKRV